jgi:hypothetical protein
MTPGALVVLNSLFDTKDPRVLTQDLMLVQLPNHTYIDVSWFPEHDPNGAYTVSVIRDGEQIHEVEVKDAWYVLSTVESLALLFSQSVSNVSCSETQTQTFEYQPAAA